MIHLNISSNICMIVYRVEESKIEEEVDALREKLLASLAGAVGPAKGLKPSDTHAIAAAKKSELDKMARALGTRHDYAEGDDRSENNIRYGSIPQRVPRRYKTIKKVELFHGNFVLDSAVPTKLLNMCPLRNEREFTHMRYSAATCDPNDFKEAGFTLRQVHYDPPRKTELFIVMTMYNEDEELFCRTMHGVMKNVAHLCKRDRSKTWGKDGWKKVVVCIVSDGRQKINSRTLSVIATMGAYQDGIAKVRRPSVLLCRAALTLVACQERRERKGGHGPHL